MKGEAECSELLDEIDVLLLALIEHARDRGASGEIVGIQEARNIILKRRLAREKELNQHIQHGDKEGRY